MKTYFFIVLAFFIVGSFYSKAAEFKLDQARIELLFNKSLDITKYIRSQDSTSTADSIPEYKDPALVNRKKAAWLAILGSPLGLHSFYMGHYKAGRQHFCWNVLSIGAIACIAFLASHNYDVAEPPLSCFTLLGPVMLVYVGIDKFRGLLEGLSYLSMSDEKFRNDIVKKPKYYH
jgi:hypothetical protein